MKIIYRPEIDGLRAIAVGAVILYHSYITILGHQPFKGGFIVVDIFFVISGYLITSIILKELVTTGTFSFKHFYERRIRRILPALLFMILVSLPFAWMFLLPSSFVDFSKSILYSLGFSSNFYFHYSGQQYGAGSGMYIPFLHTWSLSVEEQYYILFPIVLLITFKYFKKYLIHILIFGFIVSLGLADWGSKNYPSASFYLLHTRIWELIAGSIMAYFEITLGHRSKNKTLNLILPSIGLFLIGHSILFFNDKMFHPSFYTLSPIIGVCIIIWFSQKGEFITNILSSKLFVGIGLISYSLYLWHYPVFAFARINDSFDSNIIYKIVFLITTIFLSIISYNLVERPARNKENKFNIICYQILFVIILLIVISLLSFIYNGFSTRVPVLLEKDLTKRHSLCQDRPAGCSFNVSSNKKVFIIGDSHMASLAYDLKDRVISKSYQFNTSVIGGCLFFPGFNHVHIKTKKITRCNNKYYSELLKNLQKEKNSIIILGGRYPVYLSNTYFNNQEGGIEGSDYSAQMIPENDGSNIQGNFKSAIKSISLENYIILVYPIPEVGWHLPRKILSQISKNLLSISREHEIKKVTTSYQVYKNRTKTSFELLNSIQGDNVYRIYPHTLFCDTTIKDRCITHDDKDIFYADTDHPSSKGAEMINDLIMKEIEKIELQSN